MSNLIFAAHDPGAAQILSGIVTEAERRGHEIRFFADGPAIDIWHGQGHAVERFNREDESATEQLADWSDLVVAGTGFGPFEITCWSELGKRGVTTFAAIDSWSNFERRFSTHAPGGVFTLPDAIGVVDEHSIKLIGEEGWCSVGLYVVGQPNLQRISGRVKTQRQSRKSNMQYTIIFFSEPIIQDFPDDSRGFDQYGVFNQFLSNLPLDSVCRILLKPHPREDVVEWERVIEEWSDKVPHSLEISMLGSDDLLILADGVVGMMTAVLMEAVLSDVPTLALQPDRKGIFVPIVDEIVPVITEPAKIAGALSSLLEGLGADIGSVGNLSDIAENADIRFLDAVELVLQQKMSSTNFQTESLIEDR